MDHVPAHLPEADEAESASENLLPDPYGVEIVGAQRPSTYDIPAGQTIALVGSTGAGKSTLAKLLSRFYDPTEGACRSTAWTCATSPTDLRRGWSWSPRRRTCSRARSPTTSRSASRGEPGGDRAAAKAIGADDFITALPDGYDTDVRKRGGRVSAGQRQLISFARAFLADPAVLILDEATSSLDIPGERAVQAGAGTLLPGRTAVIIAHRLSTVAIADRVLVMEHGRIVEDGTPDDLIAGTGRSRSCTRRGGSRSLDRRGKRMPRPGLDGRPRHPLRGTNAPPWQNRGDGVSMGEGNSRPRRRSGCRPPG